MLSRNENGKLAVNTLDLDIFIADLLGNCKTRHEVEWISEMIVDTVECGMHDRLLDLEEE